MKKNLLKIPLLLIALVLVPKLAVAGNYYPSPSDMVWYSGTPLSITVPADHRLVITGFGVGGSSSANSLYINSIRVAVAPSFNSGQPNPHSLPPIVAQPGDQITGNPGTEGIIVGYLVKK